ncbi:MAG: HAD-IIB family hydrolase [Myxococcota bacterium]
MLVLLDIDGTLIGPDGDVSPAIWPVTEELRAAGGRIAVCTGRTHAGVALRIAERLDPEAPHVFHNGALVTTATGEVLYTAPLDVGTLERLVAHARRLGATIEFYTPDAIYVDEITPECRVHAEVLEIEPVERDLDEVMGAEDVIRAHWIVDRDTIEAAVALDLPDAQVGVATSPALPDSVFASITRADADKGSGARFAAEYLGYDVADAVGVGDSVGDIPLLDAVGFPYAMGDGHAEVIDGTYPLLAGVDDDGVIEALEFAIGRLLSPVAEIDV